MGADTKVSKVRVGEGFGCRDSQTRLERQHPAQQVGCLQMVDVLKIVIFKTGNDSLKLPALLVTPCPLASFNVSLVISSKLFPSSSNYNMIFKRGGQAAREHHAPLHRRDFSSHNPIFMIIPNLRIQLGKDASNLRPRAYYHTITLSYFHTFILSYYHTIIAS